MSAGSRLPVGSSARRMVGSLTSARAMTTRCCSPPDRRSGYERALCSSPTSLSMRWTFSRASSRGTPSTSRVKATLSSTVRWGSSLKSWNTTPMLRRR
ncbi:conserved hypothetical protein [Stigmatella aurantiaca DW4/3-1]|uniref:Uncharacterized protein n=1 Tax=Stigmatella aurantiaca (strain DW4/3-1) TaxID=378806 RepID=Q098L9_STIAD|nr:conserved hypothetical protein [Stigmatella aurantiaca DW4/3-1]